MQEVRQRVGRRQQGFVVVLRESQIRHRRSRDRCHRVLLPAAAEETCARVDRRKIKRDKKEIYVFGYF